jgi:hypothetical protein
MWKPRRLTILQISTACYRDSFTFVLSCRMRGWLQIKNLKYWVKKRWWFYSGICPDWLRETSVRISSLCIEIWTRDLLNMKGCGHVTVTIDRKARRKKTRGGMMKLEMRQCISNSDPWTSTETWSESRMFQCPQSESKTSIQSRRHGFVGSSCYKNLDDPHIPKASPKTIPSANCGDGHFDCLKLCSQNLQLGNVEETKVHVFNCQQSSYQFNSISFSCFI